MGLFAIETFPAGRLKASGFHHLLPAFLTLFGLLPYGRFQERYGCNN